MKKIGKLLLVSSFMLLGLGVLPNEDFFESVFAQETDYSISDFEGTYTAGDTYYKPVEEGKSEQIHKEELGDQIAYILETVNTNTSRKRWFGRLKPTITVEGDTITYKNDDNTREYTLESQTGKLPVFKINPESSFNNRPEYLIFDTDSLYFVYLDKGQKEFMRIVQFKKEDNQVVNSKLDNKLVNIILEEVAVGRSDSDQGREQGQEQELGSESEIELEIESEQEQEIEPEPEAESVEKDFNSDDYELLTYEEIMRDRAGKMLTKHTFYAEVLQYQEDDGFAFALLMRNGDSDMLYQAAFFNLPETRLMEGDIVDVYGVLLGLESYETVRGNENTTPYISVDKILVEGIDY